MSLELIILLFPILMFLDYYIKYFAQVYYLKKYQEFFEIENYPSKNITSFNFKYFFATFILTILMYFFIYSDFDYNIKKIIVGYYTFLTLSIFISLVNLLLFIYIYKDPEEITGKVKISEKFTHIINLSIFISLLIPFTYILLFLYDIFIVGAILGIILHIVISIIRLIKK